MILSGTVAMLVNQTTKRWHPILFDISPLPGPPSKDKPERVKSVGHHTEGFENREDAVASAKEVAEKTNSLRVQIEEDIPWDGKGRPAMVGFISDDKLVFL
jgi:hypothetical protein